MKILIVDDEQPARERLCRLVNEVDGFTVCGEAANGREALLSCEAKEPDLVLMDIRMPGMDGLEAARHLADLEQSPAVIFTTAYGDHALEAFETHAVDYLLKPIRKQRLLRALGSASRLTRAQAGAVAGPDRNAQRSHLCARIRGRLQLIPVAEIRYFQAEDKYVMVHFGQEPVLIEESLKALEEEFAGQFLRVHRNALVARPYLHALEKGAAGRIYLHLHGAEEPIEVSRRHVAAVRRVLKQAAAPR